MDVGGGWSDDGEGGAFDDEDDDDFNAERLEGKGMDLHLQAEAHRKSLCIMLIPASEAQIWTSRLQGTVP